MVGGFMNTEYGLDFGNRLTIGRTWKNLEGGFMNTEHGLDFETELRKAKVNHILDVYPETLDIIHDVLVDALDVSYDSVVIHTVLKVLPIDILNDVIHWGPNDTEVRDKIGKWTDEHKNAIQEIRLYVE